jgi:hypothetical protein
MERMPIKTITHEVPLMELYENVTF